MAHMDKSLGENNNAPLDSEGRPKVILVGGDHYNGLSLVRLFGKSGLKPHGIIVNQNGGGGFLRKSKYWEQVRVVSDDSYIIEALDTMRGAVGDKPVVIPWSDGAAAALDANLDTLGQNYILPSIGNAQGAICSLMDKGKQVSFASDCGLGVARSFEVLIDDWADSVQDIPLPCIGKPIVSAIGEKKDIRKCTTRNELEVYLAYLQGKGYSRILLQEYVSIDAEYDIEGFVDGENSSYFVVEKVRTWPVVGGPTSYAFSVEDSEVNAAADSIVTQLRTIGYSGLFDVELFRTGNNLLFNEINWRNSAMCFAAVESGVRYPLYWYESVRGKTPLPETPKTFRRYAMCELLDIRNVADGGVGIRTWVSDFRRSNAFAYYDSSDMAPLFYKIGVALHRRLTSGMRN